MVERKDLSSLPDSWETIPHQVWIGTASVGLCVLLTPSQSRGNESRPFLFRYGVVRPKTTSPNMAGPQNAKLG
jgi:hypothetical protein